MGVTGHAEDLRLVHINQNFLDNPYANFTFVLDVWQGEPRICEPEKRSDVAFFAQTALPEKCTLNVRVTQAAKFVPELTYSLLTKDNYQTFMHEPYVD